MSREGIDNYEQIMDCQILDKYNLTDRKVPAITIKGGIIRFNLNAIHLLGDTPYVEILINREEKYMLVKPCEKLDVFAIDWCKVNKKTNRTESKDITSKYLSPKLYNLMGWSTDNSYKIQCFFQSFGDGKTLLFFDLTEYVTLVSSVEKTENGKIKKSTKPYYLTHWAESFGPPLHKIVEKVTQDFRGYYVIDEKENSEQQEVFRKDTGGTDDGTDK